jgi:DNA-damage-inducible protein J
MKTIQVRVDDNIKTTADSLFTSLGLDTSTAVRIFLNAAIANGGIPFYVKHKENSDLLEAAQDTRKRRNLTGPFANAEDAISSMLES